MPIYKLNPGLLYYCQIPFTGSDRLGRLFASLLGNPAFKDGNYFDRKAPWSATSPQNIDSVSLSHLFPGDFFNHSMALVCDPCERITTAYLAATGSTELDANAFSDWLGSLITRLTRNKNAFDNNYLHQTAFIPPGAKIFRAERDTDELVSYLVDTLKLSLNDGELEQLLLSFTRYSDQIHPKDRLIIQNFYDWDYLALSYPKKKIPHKLVYSNTESTSAKLQFAIKLPCPTEHLKEMWGDYHFAASLAKSLRAQGHKVRLDTKEDWERRRQPEDVDIVIRGLEKYSANPANLCLYWLISNPEKVSWNELAQADHIFIGSLPLADGCRPTFGNHRLTVLPQAFDKDIMFPEPTEEKFHKPVFVGMCRQYLRNSVAFALQSGINIDVIGPGWENTQAASFQLGKNVENSDLGRLYRSYKVVLNDHTPEMRNNGLVSNRIFDALACGRAVISDNINWIPDDLKKWIYVYDTPQDFKHCVEEALNETESESHARLDFARSMIAEHSFDSRAKTFTDMAFQLLTAGRKIDAN